MWSRILPTNACVVSILVVVVTVAVVVVHSPLLLLFKWTNKDNVFVTHTRAHERVRSRSAHMNF